VQGALKVKAGFDTMKYALVFLLFGAACAYHAATSQVLGAQVLAAWCAIAFGGVGLAYGFVGPRAFLKQPDGRLSWLSYALFGPYHALNWFSLLGFRRAAKENAWDKIGDNVFLGCRLSERDVPEIKRLGVLSVLDLTSEFSEVGALRALSYRCIPILDTRAPSLESLRDGAEWIDEGAARGPVYVHCALGHGRSATFVAAYLLRSRQARTVEEAIEKIQLLRPRIGLHPEQASVLRQLAAEEAARAQSEAL
jgi:protein-tyrosine phosphatase